MIDEGQAGKAIWPADVERVLGIHYFSASQLMRSTSLEKEQLTLAIEVLVETGVLEQWLAPECPECQYVWPQALNSEMRPPQTICPVCNHQERTQDLKYYQVYKRNPSITPG